VPERAIHRGEDAIMESGKSLLPLVVTTSSGVGGVSPPFSILPEKLAEQTGAFGHAAIKLMAAPVGQQKEAAEIFSSRLEDVARSLDRILQDANRSALSVNAAIGEAFRVNVEQGLRFFDDLVAAKGPCDVLNLQFGFLSSQMQLFTEQSKDLQREFAKNFRPPPGWR
jgi:hypothetical protein